MTRYKGYIGKILRVDLSNGNTSEVSITDDFAERWIGGRGFIAKMLYDELEPGIDPLSPKNKLIFMTGPLAGTMIPLTGKYTVGMKSPLTKTISVSYCGGHFGPTMKFAGYDGVVFEGRSEKKVYAFLHDGQMELKDASHLWGKTTHETEDMVAQELGSKPNTRIASIGPAGENLVRIASIMSDKHAAAREVARGLLWVQKASKPSLFVAQDELRHSLNRILGERRWRGLERLLIPMRL